MATIKTFQELDVWKESHQLTLLVYRTTFDYPKHELFGLVSQSRRSASSVPANIVEGFRRKNLKESISFYNRANASLEELKYHILLAKDLQYINEQIYATVLQQSEVVGKVLTRWIQSQQQYLTT